MAKKIILIIPNATAEQQLAVNSRFPVNRAAWWHRSPDVWLLYIAQDLTVQNLRDEIKQLIPGAYCLVFEIAPGAPWCGWGPNEWRDWLQQFWP